MESDNMPLGATTPEFYEPITPAVYSRPHRPAGRPVACTGARIRHRNSSTISRSSGEIVPAHFAGEDTDTTIEHGREPFAGLPPAPQHFVAAWERLLRQHPATVQPADDDDILPAYVIQAVTENPADLTH